MPRLLILTLPLLFLWWASMVGWKKERASQRGHEEMRVVWDTVQDQVREGVPRQTIGGKEIRTKDFQIDRKLLAPAEVSDRRVYEEWARARERSRGAFAEVIWSRIEPALREGFDESERDRLLSYVGGLISPAGKEQAWLCWADETPEGMVAAYHEAERLAGIALGGYGLLANQFLSGGRWMRTATDGSFFGNQGDSSIITWSIVPDGTVTPGLDEQESAGSNFRAWMAAIYGGSVDGPAEEQPWFEIFENAVAAMEATCGVTLVYEASDDGVEISSSNTGVLGRRGDIRISARALDGDNGNLALAFGPDHGDMIFDSIDGVFENLSGSSIRLFNTITHELGHCLGLAHVCPINRTKLLEPILTTTFRGPQFDEYQSLQRLYGDAMERHGSFRENDTFTEATPISVSLLEVNVLQRLSIDGRTDLDFFQFDVLEGQRITVELVPGESQYLEGEQLLDGCSQGTSFDSRSVQDLAVEILDEDGVTILAEGNEQGSGETEGIGSFEFPRDGTYFVKVGGDGTNAAQLYELRLALKDRLPGPRLIAGEWNLVAESGSVKNGRLDPNETIALRIELTNEGELPTGLLRAGFTGSANVEIFSQSVSAMLEPGESGVVELVYGAEGECGDFAGLSLLIEDETGSLLEEERSFELGDLMTTEVFAVDFEGSSRLPLDWTTQQSGSGEAWRVVISQATSGLRTAFAEGQGSVGESSLISPTFVLAPEGGTLSFQHLYQLETGFDGGVLEASRNQERWFDLIEDPEVIVTGGYNRTIREGFGSAIAGQRAWSGQRNDFLATTAIIPASWAGEMIRFRWRVVHDESSLREGWWLDDVKMEMTEEDCELHRPEISLSLVRGALDENFPGRPAVLALQSDLPLVTSVLVTLGATGSAGPDDFNGELSVVYPAGVTEFEFPLLIRQDEEVEGTENLIVTVPAGSERFVPGSPSFVNLEIGDQVDFESWSDLFFAVPVEAGSDADGDGLSEIAEYLLGTDPTSVASKRGLSLERFGNGWLIPLPSLPIRTDAVLGVEVSVDLQEWNSVEFETRSEGLLVFPEGKGAYLRLTFSLIQ